MKNRGAGAFLILTELAVSILFFAIAAAVCLLLFVKADSMTNDSRIKTKAVFAAETSAELFRANGIIGLNTQLPEELKISESGLSDTIIDSEIKDKADTVYVFYYDSELNRCKKQDAEVLICNVIIECDDGVTEDRVTACNADGSKTYVRLSSAHYEEGTAVIDNESEAAE